MLLEHADSVATQRTSRQSKQPNGFYCALQELKGCFNTAVITLVAVLNEIITQVQV